TLCNIFAEVLGLDKVGITDDFFRIGGNSILAIHLVNEITKQTALKLFVTDVLSQKTIEKILNAYTKEFSENDNICNLNLDDYKSSLNHMEKDIYFHQLSSGNKLIYNESFVLKFNEEINLCVLQDAINYICSKYEILRSNYIFENNEILRKLNKKPDFIVKQINLEVGSDLKELLSKLEQKEFNLEKDFLIRCYLINLDNSNQICFIQFHHLIADATSIINILLPDLYSYILDQNAIASIDTQTIEGSYIDLVSKLNKLYDSNKLKYRQHWLDRINVVEGLNLNNCIGDSNDFSGEQLSFNLDNITTRRIKRVSEKLGCSLFSILYSQFALMLQRFSGKENIAIRTNIDERMFFPEHLNTVGCFINNTFLFSNFNPDQMLCDFIKDTQNNIFQVLSRQIKFQDLLKLDREKVEQLSEIHLNIETQEVQALPYEQVQTYSHSGNVKTGLYFELDIKDDRIYCRTEFQKSKYLKYLVQSLIDSYVHLLESIDENINICLKDINLLDKKDYKHIVYDWNQTDKDYPKDKTIYQLFEEQV
ncbi:condensation domain-containing protein, partial [Francisella sp. 19X1-34]|uniref:condensation domain-containing protein n=1 Tax=Francisella sp. 19X1-34 TaxID=3087177 RepID=UPI002E30A01A